MGRRNLGPPYRFYITRHRLVNDLFEIYCCDLSGGNVRYIGGGIPAVWASSGHANEDDLKSSYARWRDLDLRPATWQEVLEWAARFNKTIPDLEKTLGTP